jgi:hypothetical protein
MRNEVGSEKVKGTWGVNTPEESLSLIEPTGTSVLLFSASDSQSD